MSWTSCDESCIGRRGLFLMLCWLLCTMAAVADDLVMPDAATFRAYDRPSDEGDTIAVEWAVTPDAASVYYVLEMASEKDFEQVNFRPVTDKPIRSGASLKSDEPKYFGHRKENTNFHYVGVVPAQVYPPERRTIEPTKEELVELAGLPREYIDLPDDEFAKIRTKHSRDPHVCEWLARQSTREAKRLRELRKEVNGRLYYFRLAVSDDEKTVYVEQDGKIKVVSGKAEPNYFKMYKLNNIMFSVLFCGTVLLFIQIARRKPNLFIRRIAGLDAVEEALGRATEMGRPVFFLHGLGGLSGLATIAALSILNRVCQRVAEYDLRLRVTNLDPFVTAVSQEVAKHAYTETGRPDAYNEDDISLVATEQFTYVAAVGGMIVRERPAAIFLMGTFMAESLLLAETGASTGAIQVAGTDVFSQLPFFVTSCDYTLIGEELYAASAYLSREPRMLGSLRGQDIGKAFLMAIFVAGTLLATCGIDWIQHIFQAY